MIFKQIKKIFLFYTMPTKIAIPINRTHNPNITHFIGRSVWFLPTLIHFARHNKLNISATNKIIPLVNWLNDLIQLSNGSNIPIIKPKLTLFPPLLHSHQSFLLAGRFASIVAQLGRNSQEQISYLLFLLFCL